MSIGANRHSLMVKTGLDSELLFCHHVNRKNALLAVSCVTYSYN